MDVDRLHALVEMVSRHRKPFEAGSVEDNLNLAEQHASEDPLYGSRRRDHIPLELQQPAGSSESTLVSEDILGTGADSSAEIRYLQTRQHATTLSQGPSTSDSSSTMWPDDFSTSPIQQQEIGNALPTKALAWGSTEFSPPLGLSSDLVDKIRADELIDAYFDRVHRLWPFVHEGNFRAQYENLWARPDIACDPSSAPWLALLNMVFAHACEFCHSITPNEIPSVTLTFTKRAQNIIISHVFTKTAIELVQALLLLCHQLKGALDLDECWNWHELLLQAANSLDLGSELGGRVDVIEDEVRKRAWWGCFHMDQSLSAKLGRRPLSNWNMKQGVGLPLEVDDQYINNGTVLPRQPNGLPSATSFFVSTLKLGQVMIDMLEELYLRRDALSHDKDSLTAVPTNQYRILSETLRLDGNLQSWKNATPSHLTQEPCEFDSIDLQRQRYVFILRYDGHLLVADIL